jgi:two-component system sensor histidine kinase/response regulator
VAEVIRVLLIEDDEDDYFLTSDYLEQCDSPTFKLTWVTNSADAINALQYNDFDLCLLDYLLGAENAVDVLDALKSNQFNLPVVILTGQSDAEVDEQVMRAGAADYLQKSEIETPRFMRTIRYAMVRREIENERLERNKIEQQNKAKDKFLAHLGHELRTPLTSILGYTELLLDEPKNAQLQQELSTIHSNGKHLLNLLNDLLDMSRIMADKLEISHHEVNLGGFLADLHSLMKLAAEDKGLELVVSTEGSLPECIYTDPTRLRQILINLISNAIKFTDTGVITLLVTMEYDLETMPNEKIVFSVMDTGIGMPPDKLDSIFTPFEQIEDVMRANHGGAGLGLAISRELVSKLGGVIDVDSVFGKGSTFTFYINPGNIAAQPRIKTIVQQTPHQPVKQRDINVSGRVLIVDDIHELRRLTGHIVAQSHANVAFAENGVKALEAVLEAHNSSSPFDLILMDIHMPVMSGIDALKAIRKHGITIPIVAMTAASRKGLKRSLLDDGFDDVIGKPLDRSELIELLAHYLTASDSTTSPKSTLKNTVSASPPTSRQVLVVEDDEDTAELLQIFLSHQGHNVHLAHSGQEALEHLHNVEFDYVLLDLTLPDYHGYDLAKEIAAIQQSATLIIVSGYEPDKDIVGSLGVSASLLKPITKEDIATVIR